MEKTINHFSHEEHPLILKELQVNVACYGCKQTISGGSMMYCCNQCGIFLHKSCAELPLEITFPLHPQHSLKLLSKAPYAPGYCICDICRRNFSGFTYHCSECAFDVDVLCAQLDVVVKYQRHIHEEHPLVLRELLQQEGEEVRDEEKVAYNCYVCKEPVSGSTYFCVYCEILFHKSCVEELPSEIKHPMHFEHPLKLFDKSPYREGICLCSICKSSWSGFTYHCSECEFDVDVVCARLSNVMIYHPSHHHPLKVQQRSALFECDGCGLRMEDKSYYCTACSFWIHKACASLPATAPFKDHPQGHLSLAYCFPGKYRSYGLKCDVCRGKLHPTQWLYYCGPCRYFVHLHCMFKQDAPDDEVPPNVIRLPVKGLASSALIQQLSSEHNNNGLPQIGESTANEINHFSHHHPLVVSKVEDDYSEMYEDDRETVCDGCAEPIFGSCYSCAQCKYFLHSHCAQLPTEILFHPDHPWHILSLSRCNEFFRFPRCRICPRECNGFFYECKECNFLVDIKCALLPLTVNHEAHKHLLTRVYRSAQEYQLDFRRLHIQDKISPEECNACKRKHGDVILGCKLCEFYLGTECLMLPQIVRHRWDDHPLVLSAPPFHYHEDEFICEICEEEIHPKCWQYLCRQCDNSFHPYCIPRLDKFPCVKFGGTLEIDYHPHPLTFVRNAKYMSLCHRCPRNLSREAVFECESCMLSLCRVCVCEIVGCSPCY